MNNTNQMPQMLNQIISSPLFKRAQDMTNGKSPAEIEQIARNICAQRGVDFDDALKEFKKFLGQ